LLLAFAALAGCASVPSTASPDRAGSGTPIAATATTRSASNPSETPPPGDPIGGSWTLTRLVVDGVAVPLAPAPWHAPTLQFRPGRYLAVGQVVGDAGCNSYSAAYTFDGASLYLGPAIAQTLVLCQAPAMAVDDAYLAALPRVERFLVEDVAGGNALTLMSMDGKVRLTYFGTYGGSGG
jgi:heat shock protein HslJ